MCVSLSLYIYIYIHIHTYYHCHPHYRCLYKTNTPPEKKTHGHKYQTISNQGLDCSFGCWIAGPRRTSKERFFADTCISPFYCCALSVVSNFLIIIGSPPCRRFRDAPLPPVPQGKSCGTRLIDRGMFSFSRAHFPTGRRASPQIDRPGILTCVDSYCVDWPYFDGFQTGLAQTGPAQKCINYPYPAHDQRTCDFARRHFRAATCIRSLALLLRPRLEATEHLRGCRRHSNRRGGRVSIALQAFAEPRET